jgi:hypothetical protein
LNRDLAKRLVKLESRRGPAIERMSDEYLIAAIRRAEAGMQATLGDGWEAAYRQELASKAPHLLSAWDERCETMRQIEKTAWERTFPPGSRAWSQLREGGHSLHRRSRVLPEGEWQDGLARFTSANDDERRANYGSGVDRDLLCPPRAFRSDGYALGLHQLRDGWGYVREFDAVLQEMKQRNERRAV